MTTYIRQHNVSGVNVRRRYWAPSVDRAAFYTTNITVSTEHLGTLELELFSPVLIAIEGAELPESLPVEVLA
jgi:hypothetical protein